MNTDVTGWDDSNDDTICCDMIHNQSYSKREKRDGGVAGRVPREEGQQGMGGVRGLAIKARVPTLFLMFSVNEPPASPPLP